MRIVRPTEPGNESRELQEGIRNLFKKKKNLQSPLTPEKTESVQREIPYVSTRRPVRLIPIVIGSIVTVAMIFGILILNKTLAESRDKIRRNDLLILRNAIELYKFNHRKHYAPASDTFDAFSGSLIPLFSENLPYDPGSFSYYYARSTTNPELYTLAGRQETGGSATMIRYGIGENPIDPQGVDGNPSTKPTKGVEFGFHIPRTSKEK